MRAIVVHDIFINVRRYIAESHMIFNSGRLTGYKVTRLLVSTCAVVGVAALAQAPPIPSTPLPMFSPAERAQIVAFWMQPGRVNHGLPSDLVTNGLWQVRPDPAGSTWLLKYQIAEGAAAAPPTVAPTAIQTLPDKQAWQNWVTAAIAWDKYRAQITADHDNERLQVGTQLGLEGVAPPQPGPMPQALQAACGDAPPFADVVAPQTSTVTFDDGSTFTYQDHTNVPLDYAYYRFPQGTDTGGTPVRAMPKAEVDALFERAGLTEPQAKAAKAVSMLEGGFDSVNTYDTGYVSIGFLQFITAGTGNGDLMHVLLREKQDNITAFNRDFHYYGVDVTPNGVLDVVNPETGNELTGTDAVMAVIRFKRLTAVFQHAGEKSNAFKIAQIETAGADYWPANDAVTVTVNGTVLTGLVSDVVHSEAGMTTLFDRKVNRGSINPFPAVLQKVMQQNNLSTIAAAAPYERDIIKQCIYRHDFLKDKNLSQPPPSPMNSTSPSPIVTNDNGTSSAGQH